MGISRHAFAIVASQVISLFLGSCSPTAIQAEAQGSVEARLARLERTLSGRALLELMDRIDGLQKEIQQIRDQIEHQNHDLTRIRRAQRDRYLYIDKRLARMEDTASSPDLNKGKRPFPRPPTSAKTGTAAPANANAAREQAAYQKALDLLKGKHYDKAIEAFKAFLKRYPRGQYANKARYWLGEASAISTRPGSS